MISPQSLQQQKNKQIAWKITNINQWIQTIITVADDRIFYFYPSGRAISGTEKPYLGWVSETAGIIYADPDATKHGPDLLMADSRHLTALKLNFDKLPTASSAI